MVRIFLSLRLCKIWNYLSLIPFLSIQNPCLEWFVYLMFSRRQKIWLYITKYPFLTKRSLRPASVASIWQQCHTRHISYGNHWDEYAKARSVPQKVLMLSVMLHLNRYLFVLYLTLCGYSSWSPNHLAIICQNRCVIIAGKSYKTSFDFSPHFF